MDYEKLIEIIIIKDDAW